MSPRRRRLGRSLAPLAAALALACSAEEQAPAPPAAPEAAAGEPATAGLPAAAEAPTAAPSGPVVARTVTPSGEPFEAAYGKAGQLPTGFPADVPLYGNARPLSSMASATHGTVVNLRSDDRPQQLFAWYRDQYARQGWQIEIAREEDARSTLVARKGNRVSSVVIMGVPGATQALLTVAEDP